MRLIAAEAYADRGTGAWVNALMPLLQDTAGLTRLRAAELLAPVNPEAARGVLTAAAADNNPVVRAEATRILDAPAIAAAIPSDLPSLRRLLRDPDPGVRLHAAGIVIGLAAGGR
jgi:HEAT repeat protein